MNKLNNVYKCDSCGNMVEMVHASGGQLVCCGDPMKHLNENTTDAAVEKHVPAINVTGNRVEIIVGSVEHPMTDDHYIEWIELITQNEVFRKQLQPGEKPQAVFQIDTDKFTARAYCNLHGLWKSE